MAEVVEFVQTMAGALWSDDAGASSTPSRASTSAHAHAANLRALCQAVSTCPHRKRIALVRNRADLACASRRRTLMGTTRLEQAAARQRARAACARQGGSAVDARRGAPRLGAGVWHRVVAAGRPRSAGVGARDSASAVDGFLAGLERQRRDDPEDRALWDDDDWASALYDQLAHAWPRRCASVAKSERDAIDALLEQDVEHRCWCSLDVVPDTPERKLLRYATARGCKRRDAHGHVHARTRARRGHPPVPLPRPPRRSGVRLARVLASYDAGGPPLPARGWAATLPTCRSQRASTPSTSSTTRIESDTLVPFGELVGVAYQSRRAT